MGIFGSNFMLFESADEEEKDEVAEQPEEDKEDKKADEAEEKDDKAEDKAEEKEDDKKEDDDEEEAKDDDKESVEDEEGEDDMQTFDNPGASENDGEITDLSEDCGKSFEEGEDDIDEMGRQAEVGSSPVDQDEYIDVNDDHIPDGCNGQCDKAAGEKDDTLTETDAEVEDDADTGAQGGSMPPDEAPEVYNPEELATPSVVEDEE